MSAISNVLATALAEIERLERELESVADIEQLRDERNEMAQELGSLRRQVAAGNDQREQDLRGFAIAVRDNRKIDAIKSVRGMLNIGLKDAKDFCEAYAFD